MIAPPQESSFRANPLASGNAASSRARPACECTPVLSKQRCRWVRAVVTAIARSAATCGTLRPEPTSTRMRASAAVSPKACCSSCASAPQFAVGSATISIDRIDEALAAGSHPRSSFACRSPRSPGDVRPSRAAGQARMSWARAGRLRDNGSLRTELIYRMRKLNTCRPQPTPDFRPLRLDATPLHAYLAASFGTQ